jgi:hypothetical protein
MNSKNKRSFKLFASSLIMVIGSQVYASETVPNYSKHMDCKIKVPANGHLPAIPKFDFEIGRESSTGDLLLKETPLRPLGSSSSFEKMQTVGSLNNTDVFKTIEATVVVVTAQNSQNALILTTSDLVYECTSTPQICASGAYDAAADSCIFENSIIPIPK